MVVSGFVLCYRFVFFSGFLFIFGVCLCSGLGFDMLWVCVLSYLFRVYCLGFSRDKGLILNPK